MCTLQIYCTVKYYLLSTKLIYRRYASLNETYQQISLLFPWATSTVHLKVLFDLIVLKVNGPWEKIALTLSYVLFSPQTRHLSVTADKTRVLPGRLDMYSTQLTRHVFSTADQTRVLPSWPDTCSPQQTRHMLSPADQARVLPSWPDTCSRQLTRHVSSLYPTYHQVLGVNGGDKIRLSHPHVRYSHCGII